MKMDRFDRYDFGRYRAIAHEIREEDWITVKKAVKDAIDDLPQSERRITIILDPEGITIDQPERSRRPRRRIAKSVAITLFALGVLADLLDLIDSDTFWKLVTGLTETSVRVAQAGPP